MKMQKSILLTPPPFSSLTIELSTPQVENEEVLSKVALEIIN